MRFFNDSRKTARRMYKKLHLNWLFNTSTFIGNLFIALIISYFFRRLGYGEAVDFVFLVSILSVGLWVTEAIPPFAVGILIISLLSFGFGTDYLLETKFPVELFTGTWTSNVIWLLLGGFFLAEGMRIAGLDRALFRFTVERFGNQEDKLLLGLMFTTAIASMVMSNTATTAMMITSVLPLVHTIGKSSPFSKAILTGIPAAASVGGVGTIIGSTPNAIAVGALQEVGIYISFTDWMAIGFPMVIILVYMFWYFLKSRLKLGEVRLNLDEILQPNQNTDKFKRRAVMITVSVTIIMWLTEYFHGLPVAATSAIPILFLTITQVIRAEHVRKLPWDTLMLVAGGLALGIAIVKVGLAEIVINEINALPISVLFVTIIFSVLAVLVSNVMSNTAAASILVPLAASLALPFGITGPIIVALSCSCAVLLPVSTPANAIAYSTGMMEQKDFRQGGIFFIILAPIFAFGTVMLWYLIAF
ncbi:DASS family sodium-coupled anion symporter [Marivirga arenosa]|uniref:DASS family sodium-coupled anion symporter n=1 Tax=Marivirga arenosa TaxID=3059076 RepID=A0AA49GGW1_9BACT|nr:DASS family sodium-coupled anion symporter [Marivirga sp. ABR2-2]WKK87833.2 DASS family sodium-coupled anion symporter [Marivirga sp. ABR2-2]